MSDERGLERGLGRVEFGVVAALWAAFVCAYVTINLKSIATLSVPGVDDILRLQQVRDFLAGQDWFDHLQHRINPPEGGMLHWTRFVDVPYAALITLLRPFVGETNAEIAAGVIVPMLVMGLIMMLAASIASKLVGRKWALLTAVSVPMAGLIYPQIMPLRFDHHGWQIVCAMVVLWVLMDERRALRSGVIAGAAGAMWLNISLEGLPMMACVLGVLGLRWLMDARALTRLQAIVWTFTGVSLVLETATFAFAWTGVVCDRLSSPYYLALAIACGGALAGGMSVFVRDWRARVGLGAAISVLAIAAFALRAPQCAAGPFSDLEPLVKTYWLDNIGESLPLWRLGAGAVIAHGGFALVGVIGAFWAWRSAPDHEARMRWMSVALLTGFSSLLMLMVTRTGGVAQAYASVGAVFFASVVVQRVSQSKYMLKRVFGASLAVLAATPALYIGALRMDQKPYSRNYSCEEKVSLMGALPTGIVFAPLDFSPEIIARTSHSVIATGHHRNHVAMNDVIAAFTGDSNTAHANVLAHGASYVALCATQAEAHRFQEGAPKGFAAQLMAGQTPSWLTPVALGAERSPLLLYRVQQ